jgi:hypothetical protein
MDAETPTKTYEIVMTDGKRQKAWVDEDRITIVPPEDIEESDNLSIDGKDKEVLR